MSASFPIQEGVIPFHGYLTWYRIVGEDQPDKLPLIVLHGGQGFPHEYVEPLEAMAATARRVVLELTEVGPLIVGAVERMLPTSGE